MHAQEEPEGTDPAGLELIEPEDFLPPSPFPIDARRMGIDRWSDDAGIIAVAASLDPAKRSHKVVAWLMLLAMTFSVLGTVWLELNA